MRVGGRRNEQVHHSSPRLTAHSHNCGSKQPVAGGHRVIDRQGGDSTLEFGQPTQPLGPNRSVRGDEHAEMQFSGYATLIAGSPARGTRPRQSGRWCRGSLSTRKIPRIANRLIDQTAVALPTCRPLNASAMPSHRSHRFRGAGTRRAASRPDTVMSISSPPSTRRTSSDASWRSSRSPTVSMGRMVQLCYHVGMDIELGRRTRFPAEWTPTFGPVSR